MTTDSNTESERTASGEEAGPGSGASSSSGYSIAVVQDGRELARFGLGDLRSLPGTTIVAEGREQEGPLLTTVLGAAGAGDFREVTITGIGARDSGHLTLVVSDVTDRVLVDFSARGTVKICSPDLEWSEWVRDVTQIRLD